MSELFPSKSRLARRPKQSDGASRPRRKVPTRPWRDLLPIRRTTLGVPYTDPERAERLRVALVGMHMDRQAELLMDRVMAFLAEDKMALRIYELRDVSPPRVPGRTDISPIRQQAVRNAFARGECRGRHYHKLPFTVRVHKKLHRGAVLQHGVCMLDNGRGLDLGLVSGGTYRAKPMDWAAIEDRGMVSATKRGAPRGCALVVGNSDAKTTWAHLSSMGAVAVYPTDSNLLYVLKMLPEHIFPTPFDLASLRRRAGSEGL